ncbi:c-type cytochrome [Novosphingobium mangrovi (ex Hu et al. 2023)]|uniref:Cytochrome c n=1 Tax=Novosphingobium mangrovi (ex Hu et al. 2023) TaxID=2930094 RepID=A0ABT0AHB2_9SPHN|nr:cytochrome c [Novosphingobium mangrovi (ex Hu et al. 2023)]MCJ1962598.1 cytochrome c [Novosphingobium mangrovi (ex Hu et al. 2023)]
MALKSVTGLAAPALALALSLSACSGSEPAGDPTEAASVDPSIGAVDAEATIEAREDNFKSLAKAMKANKAELDESSPDFEDISENATAMVTAAQKIPALFPAGTGPDSGEETDALATVWERPEDFEAAATKLIDATMALRTAAQSEDAAATKEAFGNVGMACKGCHDDFRKEKKEG